MLTTEIGVSALERLMTFESTNVNNARRFQILTAVLAGALLALESAMGAQGMAVVPLKGQPPQQVEMDTRQCYSTAVQSSGYDPAGSQTAQPAVGGRARGAAGAAAGEAVVGGTAQRRERRPSAPEASAGSQAFDTAYRSCLTARGYSVQ